MKRLFLLTCLLTLLLCAASAQAAVWFPNGYTLHRDPLCIHNAFSLESCFEKTLTMSRDEATSQYYMLCSHCYIDDAAVAETSSRTWYYNPNGGQYLHRLQNCPSASEKYHPMSRYELSSPDEIPANACNFCGGLATNDTVPIEYLFAQPMWNGDPTEKARMLPGVWTLPSENAIPFTDAMSIAKEWATQYSDKTVHVAIAFHYDNDPWGNPRETWQVVVATTLQHPICIVHIDALTGEVYGGRISNEYSDLLLLQQPEQLCLEAAEGAKVEILANRVNLRETPGGDFIARLDKGETLTLLGEGRKGTNLSYCVYSPKYGEGYVRATYAQIIHNGVLRGDGSALTDNLLTYCQELRRWQIENGFLAKDESGEFVFTRDKSLNTEKAKEEVVQLMQKHSITATTGGTAPFILTNHYGLDNLWRIFTEEEFLPGLRQEDWHSHDMPTADEARRLAEALAAVDAEYR